jgi:catechol 2,3-dioxygenase-like lactoylglutathione lyase family enzyme
VRMTQYTPMESPGAAAGMVGGRRLCCAAGAVLTLSTLTNLLLAATLFSGGIRAPMQPPVDESWRQQQPAQPDEVEGRRQAQLLPPMRYRFTSFAVTDPEASAAFVRRYLGATPLEPSEYIVHRQVGQRAIVRGVRFPYGNDAVSSSHDVYFISEDPAVPDGGFSIADWERDRQALHHFELEDQWDWWQDWHLCLHVDTPDPVAELLLAEGIEFITRSTSLYVEVPGGLVFQVLGRAMSVAWTEPFLFCRRTDEQTIVALQAGPRQRLNTSTVVRQSRTSAARGLLPQMRPAHHAFPSTRPAAQQAFMLAHTPAIATRPAFEAQHMHGDGACGLLKWVEFEGDLPGPGYAFAMHFVHQYFKLEGSRTVVHQEVFLESIHSDMSQHNQWMNNRVGFEVSDLDPFVASLSHAGQPFRRESHDRSESLLMMAPGGLVFELIQPSPVDAIVRRKTVLLTGATGRTGRLVYSKLVDAGYNVRALIRSRSKAGEVLGCGACAETDGAFIGDVTDIDSLSAPMRGVDILVILTSSVPLPGAPGAVDGDPPLPGGFAANLHYAPGGSPREVDWLGCKNLVKTAVAAGVQQVVLVSSKGTTEPDSALDLMGGGHSLFYKLQAEVFLMGSGIDIYTIVKPCGLDPTLSESHGQHMLVASHDDEYITHRTMSRGDLATVLLKAVQMPENARGLRFDLCVDPTAAADGDWVRLFEEARQIVRN